MNGRQKEEKRNTINNTPAIRILINELSKRGGERKKVPGRGCNYSTAQNAQTIQGTKDKKSGPDLVNDQTTNSDRKSSFEQGRKKEEGREKERKTREKGGGG